MPRRARRSFTPEFKAQVVLDLLRGERSQAELCRLHQFSASLLVLWKDAFLERLPLVFQADEQRSQERQRIADLEQLVGRQALELEILRGSNKTSNSACFSRFSEVLLEPLKKASRLMNGLANAAGRSS